ncbi:hypothetical protein LJC03_05215, partial [Methanobrevibacter sp. OttesenSCG-928-I08]|nr:hypothetical protein [Methanobrevibacter sp. OttesenSCG-928-I08]
PICKKYNKLLYDSCLIVLYKLYDKTNSFYGRIGEIKIIKKKTKIVKKFLFLIKKRENFKKSISDNILIRI